MENRWVGGDEEKDLHKTHDRSVKYFYELVREEVACYVDYLGRIWGIFLIVKIHPHCTGKYFHGWMDKTG